MKSLTVITGSRRYWETLRPSVEYGLEFNDRDSIDSNEDIIPWMLRLFNPRSDEQHFGENVTLFSLNHAPFDFVWALRLIKEMRPPDATVTKEDVTALKRKLVREIFKSTSLSDAECDRILKIKLSAKAWNGEKLVPLTLDPGSEDDFQSEWGGITSVASYVSSVVRKTANYRED